MIKDDNYYVITGWMLNNLGLKGTQLNVYAVINGFSQSGQGEFNGSIGYLAEWCGCTTMTVSSALNELVKKGVIVKESQGKGFPNKYRVNETYTEPQEAETETESKDDIPERIISYLNEKAETKYRASSPSTKRLIQARRNEGFSYEDFCRVIDNKCNEWLNNSKMRPYIRPETLFGSKFEGYLNSCVEVKKDRASSYDINDYGIGELVYKRRHDVS